METKSRMVVMDGAEQIGRSEPLLLADPPVFTTDGRYVFTLPTYGDRIIAISTETGKARSVPCEGCSDRQLECHCQLVAPIGRSQLAWLDGDNRLVIADLASESPKPEPTDITLPTEDGFLDERLQPRVIAGTEGAVLVAYADRGLPGDDLQPIYLVRPGAEPRELDPNRPDSIEQAVFSPDGSRIAVTGNQEYACATVTVVDVDSGKGETAPVSAEPGAKCKVRDVYIDTMWWDRDGTLNTTVQADDEHSDATGGQRRYRQGKWSEAEIGNATAVHQLRAGTATIRGDGSLVVEAAGERSRIDNHVRYLTAAP